MEFFALIGAKLSAWLDAAWFGMTATERIMLALGMLGQLMFVSRWFVQWMASEKARQSIVPELFWYLSFVGGALVLMYGFYSANLVLIFGQFGIFIYARNIYLILRAKNAPPAEAANTPEPGPQPAKMPAE